MQVREYCWHFTYFAQVGVRSSAMSFCFCPLIYLRNHTTILHQIFCTCRLQPWLDYSLTALRYVMYFRFVVDIMFFLHIGLYCAYVGRTSKWRNDSRKYCIDSHQILLSNEDQHRLDCTASHWSGYLLCNRVCARSDTNYVDGIDRATFERAVDHVMLSLIHI